MDPQYANNGTYGCVMRPGVACKRKVSNDKNTVSKLFIKKPSKDEEVVLHHKIIDAIDPEGIFTVKLLDNCNIKKDLFPQDEINKCRNFPLKKKTSTKSFPQILYEYGGHDLLQASRRFPFEELFLALEAAFKGIMIMGEKGFGHIDLKPENMVYNNETGKLSIIDFGLATKLDDLYVEDNLYIFEHEYMYFPPEFSVIANEWINEEDDKVDEKQNRMQLLKRVRNLNDGTNDPVIRGIFQEVNRYPEGTFTNLYQPKKVDVYMLGASIIDLLYHSMAHGNMNYQKNHKFYVGVLELTKKMLAYYPNDRITPSEAYKEYKDVVKLITVVPPSPVKPSPSRIIKTKSVRRPKEKECPPGKVLNPVTKRCVTIKVPKEPKVKECPPGKVLNPVTKRCVKVKEPKEPKVKECPPGKVLNPVTKRCIKVREPKVLKEKKAKSPKELEPNVQKELMAKVLKGLKAKVYKEKECQPGKVLNPVTKRCVAIKAPKEKKKVVHKKRSTPVNGDYPPGCQ